MKHGADTSFLVAVEIVEHANHAEGLRVLGELLAHGAVWRFAAGACRVCACRDRCQAVSAAVFDGDGAGKSERWWNAAETEQVLPTDAVVARFHDWMRDHQLGRKRVLDTLLAATYRAAGVTSLLTLNTEDFEVFGKFSFVPLAVTS